MPLKSLLERDPLPASEHSALKVLLIANELIELHIKQKDEGSESLTVAVKNIADIFLRLNAIFVQCSERSSVQQLGDAQQMLWVFGESLKFAILSYQHSLLTEVTVCLELALNVLKQFGKEYDLVSFQVVVQQEAPYI
eukprot:gb/GECG01003356.1/.p1 GENE.gb/GECG01003356.1/~~gb/GECG01003356.1/.p1  ORF type:complete len:138 (+),score=14.32 gb/GECG01003356.1/:1-414(+)